MRLGSFENNVGLSEVTAEGIKDFVIFFGLLTEDHALLITNENIKLLEVIEY